MSRYCYHGTGIYEYHTCELSEIVNHVVTYVKRHNITRSAIMIYDNHDGSFAGSVIVNGDMIITIDSNGDMVKLSRKDGYIRAKDICPNCTREYVWNTEQDTYFTADKNVRGTVGKTLVEQYYCQCGAVFAMCVNDDSGTTLMIPDLKVV